MNEPKSVKIGCINYDVQEVSGLEFEEEECIGLYSYTERCIFLQEGLDEDVKRHTLLHEVLHGILKHSGQEHSEHLIEAVSFGLLDVFDRNPKLAKYLLEGADPTNLN